jgi:cyclopropane-fatty-acyl-phospholipid synthase
MAAITATAGPTALAVLREIFHEIEPRDFAVRLWDGTDWAPEGAGEPAFTLVVERPSALRRLLGAGSEAALAEAYLEGSLSIEGDVFAVPAVGRAVLERRRTLRERARLALRLVQLPRREPAEAAATTSGDGETGLRAAELEGELHSVERDRAAVTHHYDLSNHFYSLFLDPRLVYSCAVFAESAGDLETAQLRKLDLICRKLRLQAGDRFLDIGCGWGALILHAVRQYDVEAVGITVSERQAEVARRRIREAGLEDRCRVAVSDYRTLDEDGGFHRVASVGMFEHVGRARAAEYFETIHRLLRPGGTYLHHAITANPLGEPQSGPTLSDRYVFPDHELIPIGETITFAEMAGFDVRDAENLREHYALTLRRWVAALEEHHDKAAAEVGEATWRAWRLLFAGSAVDFEAGRQGLFQILMAKPLDDGSAGVPLGRWDWYGAEPGPPRPA